MRPIKSDLSRLVAVAICVTLLLEHVYFDKLLEDIRNRRGLKMEDII